MKYFLIFLTLATRSKTFDVEKAFLFPPSGAGSSSAGCACAPPASCPSPPVPICPPSPPSCPPPPVPICPQPPPLQPCPLSCSPAQPLCSISGNGCGFVGPQAISNNGPSYAQSPPFQQPYANPSIPIQPFSASIPEPVGIDHSQIGYSVGSLPQPSGVQQETFASGDSHNIRSNQYNTNNINSSPLAGNANSYSQKEPQNINAGSITGNADSYLQEVPQHQTYLQSKQESHTSSAAEYTAQKAVPNSPSQTQSDQQSYLPSDPPVAPQNSYNSKSSSPQQTAVYPNIAQHEDHVYDDEIFSPSSSNHVSTNNHEERNVYKAKVYAATNADEFKAIEVATAIVSSNRNESLLNETTTATTDLITITDFFNETSPTTISTSTILTSSTTTTTTIPTMLRCNSEHMRSIILNNIAEKPSTSKRLIQKKVSEEIGGKIDVICSTGIFSYIVNTELYCESEKNGITCLTFRQSE